MLYLDLKLENVMMTAAGDVKLVDFGFVRCDVDVAAGQTVKRAGGTRCYLAPEAIMQQPVGASCDWWALGVLLFELLVGYGPFFGETDKALNSAICNARVRFPRDPGAGETDEGEEEGACAASPISSDAVSFVRKLLTKKVDARLGTHGDVEELKAHVFLRGVDWRGLLDGTMARPFVPTLASDVDVRYFDRKHTSHVTPLSAVKMDADAETAHVEAASASTARKLSLAATEAELAAVATVKMEAAQDAKRAAAAKAVDDARGAELKLSQDAASDAQKRVRAAQKKLRQCLELQELHAQGKPLNAEQKQKLSSIPRQEAELLELVENASALEAAFGQMRLQHDEEGARIDDVRRAEEARRQQEAERTAEAKRQQEAMRTAEAEKSNHLIEHLTVAKFAYVAPQWQ